MNTIQENNVKDCVLEVDLEYREQLYNLHKDYPLLLMKACYQVIAKKLQTAVVFQLFFTTETNLYINTQEQDLNNLKLKQSQRLKKYIDLSTDKRKDVVAKFEMILVTKNS